jgi:hypothetical protein
MNLYEITREALELASLLETEELTPELEAALVINQEHLQTKVGNYAKVIANIQSEAVEVDIVEALPSEFRNIKNVVTADKVAIKEAIKRGENIIGARIVENFSLQIK